MAKTQKSSTKKKSVDPIRSRKGKTALKKGKQFEREVAQLLGHIFPEAKRHLEYQADEAAQGVDLSNTDRFKFQCKNYQNYVPVSTIFEVKLSSEDDVPVLLTKGNRLETMAVLPFRNFIELLEIAYSEREPYRSLEQKQLSPAAKFVKALPMFQQPKEIEVKEIEYLAEDNTDLTFGGLI